MGCWNESCALTHTEIKYGDKIVIVTIKNNTSDMSGNGFMSMILGSHRFPFGKLYFGTYDTYGSINETDDNITDIYKSLIYIKAVAIEKLFGKSAELLVSEYNKLYDDYYYDMYEDYYKIDGYIDFDKANNMAASGDDAIKEIDCQRIFRKKENNFVMQLFNIFYQLRINPFFTPGCQSDDVSEYVPQVKMHLIGLQMAIDSIIAIKIYRIKSYFKYTLVYRIKKLIKKSK